MQIHLARLARERGVRRRSVRLRSIAPTGVMEGELYAIYRDGLRIWFTLARQVADAYEAPAAITADADGTQIAWLVDQAARRADSMVLYQTERLGRWVARVGEWHDQKTISAVKSALGVDIKPYIHLSDVRPYLDDSVRANVALIRDINATTRARVEAILYDALVNRRTKKHVTDELANAMGITKARARRIAGDQTHKLNIALSAYRNEQMGITTYIWQTRGDDRVRPAHRVRNGNAFAWSQPPYDGHPGFAINCRCVAAPVVELG